MFKQFNKKTRIAMLSIASNTLLIAMKVIVGVISGSVSILSEAIHSGIDLVAALMAFIAVNLSSKPADEDHPYGHGKIENISGFVEGILIFVAAALIVTESVERIQNPKPLHATSAAIAVMFISALVNLIVSSRLYKTAQEEDSIALEADALHLKTDVYTSAGVGLGLIIIKLTDITILDPVIAILVALLIVKEAWNLSRRAFNPLLDTRLPENEERIIIDILNKYAGQNFHFSNFRTRKAGSERFVDIEARINPDISVREAVRMNQHLKREIEQSVSNVNIHIEIDVEEY